MASHHYRTHSLASSTHSLSEDLIALPHHTTSSSSRPADPFNDGYAYGAQGAGDTSMSASEFGDSPYLGGESRRSSTVGLAAGGPGGVAAAAVGGEKPGRSRARAFSFLSVHNNAYGAREGDADGVSPSTGETPFVGGAYDHAFGHGEDDEVDALSDSSSAAGEGMEMCSPAAGGVGGVGGAGAGRAYRSRFQPLDPAEYALMGVSALAVVGLTVGAVVLTWVG